MNLAEFITYCTLKGIAEVTGSNTCEPIIRRYRITKGNYFAILLIQDDEILLSHTLNSVSNDLGTFFEVDPKPTLNQIIELFTDDT